MDYQLRQTRFLKITSPHTQPKQKNKLLVVLVGYVDGGDFGETLERDVSEHGHGEEFVDESGDEFRLENITQRNPV